MEQPQDNILLFSDLTEARAIKLLREIADDSSRLFVTKHAEKRMKQRKITRTQLLCCMRHGQFVELPHRTTDGSWEMKLSVMSAGDVISAVLSLDYDEISKNHCIVVTVIRG